MSEYRIFKYLLNVEDRCTVRLPRGAVLRSVSVINNQLFLWAHVPFPIEEEYDHSILIVGTGNPAPSPMYPFLGTVIMPPFVWHVFDGSPSYLGGL